MAQGFQPDSCSTTAQTRAGSMDWAAAARLAMATRWRGTPKLGPPPAAEIDEMNHGQFMQRNSLLEADGGQRRVDVRQVVEGDVADAGGYDVVGTHAAVEPAEEEDELHGDREERGEQAGRRDLG